MRRGALTLSEVSGVVDSLRVTCAKCDRFSQSHIERLIYDFGPLETVSGWTARVTADCPRRQTRNLADQCAAKLVDIPTTSWTACTTGLVSAKKRAVG